MISSAALSCPEPSLTKVLSFSSPPSGKAPTPRQAPHSLASLRSPPAPLLQSREGSRWLVLCNSRILALTVLLAQPFPATLPTFSPQSSAEGLALHPACPGLPPLGPHNAAYAPAHSETCCAPALSHLCPPGWLKLLQGTPSSCSSRRTPALPGLPCTCLGSQVMLTCGQRWDGSVTMVGAFLQVERSQVFFNLKMKRRLGSRKAHSDLR